MFKKSPRVNVARARQMIDEGAQVLDVRTKKEWDAGHIAGAIHVPVTKLDPERLGSKRIDPALPVLVVCRSGNRSKSALGRLRGADFDAVDLKGGLHAWVRSGEELTDRRGRPGVVA